MSIHPLFTDEVGWSNVAASRASQDHIFDWLVRMPHRPGQRPPFVTTRPWPTVAEIQEAAATLRRRDVHFSDGSLYLSRFAIDGWMPGDADRPGQLNCYLHNILQADEDVAPHNHPWEWACSLVLSGGYHETRDERVVGELQPGNINQLRSDTFHRIVKVMPDTWTIFVTGPKTSSWGFDVPGRGFVAWRDRLNERGIVPQY